MLEDINYIIINNNNNNNNYYYYYYYYRPQQNQGWNQQRPNYSGRPVISISIGMVDFPEAIYDFGSSVNIMPRGILKNLYVQVGTLYAPADFLVIETGTDERAPIIRGRPFLNTSGADIYASAAKISFYIKGRKETFSFKNKTTQISEQSRHEPRKRTNRRNRNKQVWTESAKMVTAVQEGQDRRPKSLFLTKKDDPVLDGRSDILKGGRLLTWEKTSTIHPSSLGDRSSAPLKQSSILKPEKSTCAPPLRRYAAILLTLTI